MGFRLKTQYISMRYSFRPHYRAERFHRKRIDLKILLKVDESRRSKTVKTHQMKSMTEISQVLLFVACVY